MKFPRCGPLSFVLTGTAWLVLAALSGMALYLGIVRSTPLSPTLRVVHAHGALFGGLLQLFIGALLALRQWHGERGATSQLGRYLGINLGTAAMLFGLWQQNYMLAGVAGLVTLGPIIPSAGELHAAAKRGWLGTGWAPWLTAFLATTLVGGSLLGLAYSLSLVPAEWAIHSRMAHVHMTVLGFTVVVMVCLLHSFTLAALHQPVWSHRLVDWGLPALVIGVIGLMVGFGLAQVPVQLGAGALMLGGVLAVGYNLFRTWLAASSRPKSADYLLLSLLFVTIASTLGLLVGVNAMFEPRPFPFGNLHLVAYTHMLFVGALLHLLVGGLLTWLPTLLAQQRLTSHKKQLAYAERVAAALERWHALQLGTLTIGTMGLAAVAALTWRYPLGAEPVQATMWISVGLLLVGIILLTSKMGLAWGTPTEDRPLAS